MCFLFPQVTGSLRQEKGEGGRGGGAVQSIMSCYSHLFNTRRMGMCKTLPNRFRQSKKKKKKSILLPFCLVFLSLCLTHTYTHNLNTTHTQTQSKTKPGLSLRKNPSVNRLCCKIQTLKVSIRSLTVKAKVIVTHCITFDCLSLYVPVSLSLCQSVCLSRSKSTNIQYV